MSAAPTHSLTHLDVTDLGRISYAEALDIQHQHHARILAQRDTASPDTPLGTLLLLEHDPPVITISKRPTAQSHLLASPDHLASLGVQTHETDRGGDITYHGPGQLVAYPIIDLNRANLRLHPYIRLLEQAIINTAEHFNLTTTRDEAATGVWTTNPDNTPNAQPQAHPQAQPQAKLAAIGVRVRRWVTLHGLALNVTTNLDHFKLIVPCGLTGRPVTSLQRELQNPPAMHDVKHTLATTLDTLLAQHLTSAGA